MSENTETTNQRNPNLVGAGWKKKGEKNGKKYEFISANIEIAGTKHYFVIRKSLIPEGELGNKPGYLIYKDDYIPNRPKKSIVKQTEEVPF